MSRTPTRIRTLPAAAAVLFTQIVAAGTVYAADAGRITGPDINRPGVALPYGNGRNGRVVSPTRPQQQPLPQETAPANDAGPDPQTTPVQVTKLRMPAHLSRHALLENACVSSES